MALVINIPNRKLDNLVQRLKEKLPNETISVWPGIENPDDVEFVLAWKHQHGSLSGFPNLKAIQSFGAGVDSILSDPELPNVPVARIVDEHLSKSMSQYVISMILAHKLRHKQFAQQQLEGIWKPKSPRRVENVFVLGAGQLGEKLCLDLCQLGFNVSAWSRTEKSIPAVQTFIGDKALYQQAALCDYLVCSLPLTEETKGILNEKLFNNMPNHSVVINVARGEHLKEPDLIDALDKGQIEHAILDVFQQEPLPSEHPFWHNENITITPHVSAVTNVDTAIEQIVNNYNKIKQNKAMTHVVNKSLGY